jgi:hypothetical protein
MMDCVLKNNLVIKKAQFLDVPVAELAAQGVIRKTKHRRA